VAIAANTQALPGEGSTVEGQVARHPFRLSSGVIKSPTCSSHAAKYRRAIPVRMFVRRATIPAEPT
jgi:hypothetical protein